MPSIKRLGNHWMPIGATGMMQGGPGYEGKHFMQAGTQLITGKLGLLPFQVARKSRTFDHAATGPYRIRRIGRSGGEVQMTVASNVHGHLGRYTKQVMTHTEGQLVVTGEQARDLALRVYLSNLKGVPTWGRRTDPTDIPSNIAYSVTGQGTDYIRLFFGFAQPSLKSFAQELGLDNNKGAVKQFGRGGFSNIT